MKVGVTTLDAFCEERGIAPQLVKIDIEGFELHALRGASRMMERYRPVIMAEIHPVQWSKIGVEAAELRALIAGAGYRVLPLDNQRDPFAEYGHVGLEPV